MREDVKRLKYIKQFLESYYEGKIRISFPEEEDYQVDMTCSAYTRGEVSRVFRMEVKTLSKKYGPLFENGGYNKFLCNIAARNNSWRWCETASTQEAFMTDTTPCPYDFGRAPINPLNLYNKTGGTENSKIEKLKAEKAGVIWLCEDGILIQNHDTLFNKAILGYGWMRGTHTTEIGKDTVKIWERKALIDMSKGVWIEKPTPEGLI